MHCAVILNLQDAVCISFPVQADLVSVDWCELEETPLENGPGVYLEHNWSGASGTLCVETKG